MGRFGKKRAKRDLSRQGRFKVSKLLDPEACDSVAREPAQFRSEAVVKPLRMPGTELEHALVHRQGIQTGFPQERPQQCGCQTSPPGPTPVAR